MRFSIVLTMLLSSQVLWSSDIPQIAPDFASLYTRVSESAVVVKATLEKAEGISSRVGPQPDEKPFELDNNGGTLYTLRIDEVMCRRSDWSPAASQLKQIPSSVHVFVPFGEPSYRRNPVDGGVFDEKESFTLDKHYLLFLREDPRQAELAKLYSLDPAITFYRAYWGKRGAVELANEDKRGGPRDFASPLFSAVSELSKAVQTRNLAEKKSRLTGLKYLAEPSWRPAVEEAIRALEEPPVSK